MNQISSPSTPATAAETSAALSVLFDSGLPFQRGAKPETAALAYIEALHGITLDAIAAGIRKFLRGECEGVSPKFVPTPPELARIVRTAVVADRIPTERRIASRPAETPAERARMKLKMPLWAHAWATGRMDQLAAANARGFEATIALAQEWGVPVHPETWEAFEQPNAEAEWRAARNRGIGEMERNPPPFMRRRRARDAGEYENAA